MSREIVNQYSVAAGGIEIGTVPKRARSPMLPACCIQSHEEALKMPNPIVYFEITGKDKAVLEDFYRAVFDWQLTPAGENYSHVIAGGGVNGGIGRAIDGTPGYVTFYVEVANLAETLSVVEGRGGQRVMEPAQMPNGPLVALFTDPEGRTIGLIQAGSLRAG